MAEPEGTADLDDSLEVTKVLDDVEELEAYGDELDSEAQAGEENTVDPPRRRRVSELLEGQDTVEKGVRADLQLVAPPLHAEVGDAGQPVYQLDLSSDEPEGTLLEPESGTIPPEPDYAPSPAAGDGPSCDATADAVDAHTALKQMIANRDRQVMAAERDGISAYGLAAGIDHFVASLVEAVRRSDS